MKRVLMVAGVFAVATLANAAPLTPTILRHDINFGAFNGPLGPAEYRTNGALPDTLIYTAKSTDPDGRVDQQEVTGWWPTWPLAPVFPIFNESAVPGGPPPIFGGDFRLAVQFTGQDAPFVNPGGVSLDVSLTGTGLNPGPDLVITGSTVDPLSGGILSGVLWAIDLEHVSMYGYSAWPSLVLEGAGTIVGGLIADRFQLIGQPGVMRGNVDLAAGPMGFIPLYHPSIDVDQQGRFGYSGETGVGFAVPEPTAAALLLIGFGLMLRRR